jgi:nucleotide-binding universal stress UspA family protein
VPQIDHVICPVDPADSSTRALKYAITWARWHQARLHVVHVAPFSVVAAPLSGVAVTLDHRPLDEVRRDVLRYIARVPDPRVPIETHVYEGDPPGFIRKLAARLPRAVVVMGSHARGGFERLLNGSVSERVAGDGVVPTLIVPPRDEHADDDPIFRRIVCAVDLLPSSLEGLRYAIAMARDTAAVLEVVHVIEEGHEARATGHFRVPEYLRYRAEEVRQDLRGLVSGEDRLECVVREHIAFGEAAEAILESAADADADLIVMGAGDRAHLRSLWLGSTTARILREAACPLLVVPTPPVIKRAMSGAAKPLARARWRVAFEQISLDHLGDPATVTVLTPGFSAPEATALPLVGITMDRAEGDIAVMLGTPDGAHLSHVVPRPTEVQLDQSRSPASTRLLLRSGDGTTTLVEVARPVGAMLEALAAGNIQF